MQGQSSRDRTILLTGAYGHGNVGDDMLGILTAETLRGYGYHVILAAGGPLAVAVDLPQSRRQLLKVLDKSTTLLLGGGGLFNDAWASDYSRYFAFLACAARLRGGSARAVGVGVEMPRTVVGRGTLMLAAQALVPFGVRDERSAAILGRYRARCTQKGVDLGWLAAGRFPAPMRGTPGLVSVTVAGETVAAARARLSLLAGALKILLADGRVERIRGVAMQRSDQESVHDDRSLLEDLSRLLAYPIEILSPRDPGEAAAIFGQSGLSVGFRLHGLLLAYLGGVPIVALSRSEKVAATFTGAPGAIVIDERRATVESIVEAVSNLSDVSADEERHEYASQACKTAKVNLLRAVAAP